MLLLLVVALVAGLVTVFSPCILPVLPVVLGSSVGGGKLRPLGVIAGLIVSFSVFTLAISEIVALLGISASVLRLAAVTVIAFLGLSLLLPALNERVERLFSRLPGMASTTNRGGFWGGALTGVSLGLVWAPCAGPILAAVTTLAATQQISAGVAVVVVAYAIGAGVPLLGIAYGGRVLAQRTARLARYGQRVHQVFGGLMLATALLMAFNLDVAFTVWATDALPTSWTTTLQSFEQSAAAQQQIDQLNGPAAPTQAPVSTAANAMGPAAPELTGITHWINSPPLTLQELHGKVVLIDFWTYSCINCIRTLPYTTAWYEKYKDAGLVVIGVHAPEFAFEHETPNVEDAVKRYQITYPVAQDNDFKTWRAYGNHYWPAEYVIDAQGVLRHSHFGEGSYDETEHLIQQLLAEKGTAVQANLVSTPVPGAESSLPETPETYIGTDRQERFASPQPVRKNTVSTYSVPATLPKDSFAVEGQWLFQPQFAQTSGADTRLRLHFTAKNAYLVMASDQPTPVDINVIGSTSANTSEDVNSQGQITVGQSRLYHLVQLPAAQDGTIELHFTQPGVKVYAFTFGS
jgi:cytochrome c biogenesis protein CcdA/thiol-disulfide isomerase/thioredoxin